MTRARVVLCFILVGGLFSPALQAEPASRGVETGAPDAVRLFHESSELYLKGEFGKAAEKLEQAYALERSPILLYNLARAYEGAGRLADAADAYERYLLADPAASARASLEERVRSLRRELRERKRLEEERVLAERRREEIFRQRRHDLERQSTWSLAPWLLGGAGTLGLGTALGLSMAASAKADAAERDPTQLGTADKNDAARSLTTAANATAVVGGALLLVGGLWAVFDVLRAERAKEKLRHHLAGEHATP